MFPSEKLYVVVLALRKLIFLSFSEKVVHISLASTWALLSVGRAQRLIETQRPANSRIDQSLLYNL